VALRIAGPIAGIAAGAMMAADPLRQRMAPNGWLSEGVSIFLVVAFMMVLTALWARRGKKTILLVAAGVVLGLLMLVRSTFVPLGPFFGLFAAIVAGSVQLRCTAKWAGIVLAVACLIAAPWWIRNCLLLGEFMPLGTQPGISNPDQYTELVWVTRGHWSALGMVKVWELAYGDAEILPLLGRDGFPARERLQQIAQDSDWAMGWFIYGYASGNIAIEKEISHRGAETARDWLADNWVYLPAVMWLKLVSEVLPVRWLVLPVLAIALLTMRRKVRHGPAARMLAATWGLVLAGALIVMLTHAASGRYLVPFMPPLYVLAAAAVASIFGSPRVACHPWGEPAETAAID
jgi:4-amino-4-deoxy-L-arabinose transferase-like glycosyltransferase